MTSRDVTSGQTKDYYRKRVWDALEEGGCVPSGVHGTIPDFRGADEAAERLAEMPEWRDSSVVKAVPDKAQYPARVRALRDGKIVYMAVPRLAREDPFYLLDPRDLSGPPEEVAKSKVAKAAAQTVDTARMRAIDLIICGSVVVNRAGVRIGKGAGYSDIEAAILWEAGLINDGTVIVTTVHDLQVLDESLPESNHDFNVDVIVTPSGIIRCPRRKKKLSLDFEQLSVERISEIPVLRRIAETSLHSQ